MSLRNRNEPSFRRIFPIISSESQGLPHLHNHWTNQRKARKLEMKRSDSKNNSNNRRIKLVSLCLAAAHLPTISKAQFCKPLHNNTWAGLVQAVVDSSGFAVLCPFEISGARCHSKQQGYVVPEEQDQIIVCDPFLYGFNSDSSECIINCPGRHFTVGHSSSLTLNNMKLFGATDSSIQVEKHGKLSVIDSVFRG